jgi:arylsulfatase A-like enzyme
MEPHSPYLPGLQRGVRAGLLKSYASLLADAKHPDRMNYRDNVPEWIQRHLRTLYEETVRKLDSTLSDWVAAHEDDATILMTGDHGEEFDHGLLTHSRLYDETVKVPLLTNRKIGSLTVGSSTRQIDLSPTLIDTLDLSQPSEWEGTPAEDTMPPQPMIGSLSRHDRFWLGVRSERWKYIKNYQREIGVTETEAYDVLDDPNETESLAESELPNELPELLNSFMQRPSIQDEISQNRGFVGDVDSTVEARLKELGYTG